MNHQRGVPALVRRRDLCAGTRATSCQRAFVVNHDGRSPWPSGSVYSGNLGAAFSLRSQAFVTIFHSTFARVSPTAFGQRPLERGSCGAAAGD